VLKLNLLFNEPKLKIAHQNFADYPGYFNKRIPFLLVAEKKILKSFYLSLFFRTKTVLAGSLEEA